MKNSLYELRQDYRELIELASDPEIDAEAWIESAYSMDAIIEDKMDGCAIIIANLKSKRDMLKAEKDRIDAMIKAIDSNEKKLETRMIDTILAMQLPKDTINTDLRKFSVVNNGGVLPLTITGEVPNNFLKIKYEPDNDKIRKAIDAGEEITFAHLEPRGKRLSIR